VSRDSQDFEFSIDVIALDEVFDEDDSEDDEGDSTDSIGDEFEILLQKGVS